MVKVRLNFGQSKLETLQMFKNPGGLHSAIRRTLLCSRLMGLFPLSGLMYKSSAQLRFTLKSLYTIIYIASVFGQFLMFLVSFCWVFSNGMTLSTFSNAFFYISSLTSLLLMINIGRTWPQVITKVEKIEARLPPFTRDVARVCNITMVLILFAAIVEHILSVHYGVTVARNCSSENVTETYFQFVMPWILEYTSFSLWKGILSEAFNLQSTFIWSFNDLFIMVISIYLTEHFIIHNELLRVAVIQDIFSAATLRLQYMEIVRLVKLINGRIGIYILTSFGSNLYWICTQLFYILNKGRTKDYDNCGNKRFKIYDAHYGTEHAAYFIFSCSFLLTRTLMVLLLAARIHSNSIAPLTILYGLPSKKYNVEVERYIAQIKYIKVALSGLDFFYVTRTMILSLFGTIVTYELVLLQFNK